MTKLFFLLPLAGLCAGCVETSNLFEKMDLDHNGVISRGEFTDAIAQLSFAEYDRNHDGQIDLAEWRAVEKGSAHDALFHARDLSRNGKISRPEARLAAEKNVSLHNLFNAIDANHDGVLERREVQAYLAAHRNGLSHSL